MPAAKSLFLQVKERKEKNARQRCEEKKRSVKSKVEREKKLILKKLNTMLRTFGSAKLVVHLLEQLSGDGGVMVE